MNSSIEEKDESGSLVATYIASRNVKGTSRVDVVVCSTFSPSLPIALCYVPSELVTDKAFQHPAESTGIWQKALNVFLPTGYPNSVTKDYLE